MGLEQHSLPRPSSSHPVLHVMHQRLQDGSSSRPGCRRDGYKLGLVVEGGGMRGIVTVRGPDELLQVMQYSICTASTRRLSHICIWKFEGLISRTLVYCCIG
jgi:hypothetical protein